MATLITCLHAGHDLQAAITALSRDLALPDTTTKSGLRKVAWGMDEFGPNLEAYYRRALKMDNDHALAAVATVWSRICVDMRLRVETLEDFAPPKVLCSFIQPHRCTMCIVAGLRLIDVVISSPVKEQFDRNLREVLPAVLKTLSHVGSHNLVSELAMRIVEHFSAYVTVVIKDPAIQQRFVLDIIPRMPTLPLTLLKRAMRAICFSVTAVQKHAGYEQLDPAMTNFFVGLLRAGYPRARRFAIRWLGQIADNIAGLQKAIWEPARICTTTPDTYKSLPRLVFEAMGDFGVKQTDTYRLRESMIGFNTALYEFTVDKDLVTLGFRIFGLLQVDPDCVWFDKSATDLCPGIGNCSPRRYGVPCDAWADILLHCASAIRHSRRRRTDLLASVSGARTPGLPPLTHEDIADVLLIRHTFSTGDIDRRFQLCDVMVERDSCFEIYLAYAMTSFGQPKAAHMGMEMLRMTTSKKTPIFQRALANYCNRLFMRIFSHISGDEASEKQIYGDEGDWAEVCENAHDARMLCGAYLKVAPPDARDRADISEIAIILDLFRAGPRMASLDEIEESLHAWRLAVETNKILWGGAFRQNTTGMLDLILKHSFESGREWRKALRRIVTVGYKAKDDFEDAYDPPLRIEPSEREALEWRNRIFAPTEGESRFDWRDVPAKVFEAFVHPTLRYKTLHQCGACRTPTVLLLRCGRCRTARYCDKDCQRRHWPEHKLTCGLPLHS